MWAIAQRQIVSRIDEVPVLALWLSSEEFRLLFWIDYSYPWPI